MSVSAHYFSPTTPGADSFDVDVSAAIRRGRIGPLSKEAQLGAVGSGVIVLDDPDGTLGHDEDGILGLKQFYMNETECPAGNQRFFTGYTFDRSYYGGDSLIQGEARKVDVTLVDANTFLSFRVFAPEDVDETSSFNRPQETHIQRIQALLAVDFLSTTLFDLGYIPTTGGVLMSAKNYEGSRPVDVLNDCAQVSGWNGWVGYDEAENKLFLWFDDWRTDGSATLAYDSTLKLTNIEAERNDTDTFLFELNAREHRDPSRVVAAAYGTGTGVKSYQTRPQTAHTFGWRDMVAPSFFVKEQDKLDALLVRYLNDNATEQIRISLTVQLPVGKVTAIKEGQRIPVHGRHLKSVADDFTWCRILHMTIRRDLETMEFYWADLEVSPIPPLPVEDFGTSTEQGGCELFIWPKGAPEDGLLLIGGMSQRAVSTYTSAVVPIGNTAISGCDGSLDVPGTEWTYIDGVETQSNPSANRPGYPITMAWRESDGEPPGIRWGSGAALNGTARPRSFQMAIAITPQAPTVVVPAVGDIPVSGSTFTSPDITIPEAGYIVAVMGYNCSGPADGFSAAFTMTPTSPNTHIPDGLQGFQYASFGGYGLMAYRYEAAGGTYNLTFSRSAAPRAGSDYSFIVAFWPAAAPTEGFPQ